MLKQGSQKKSVELLKMVDNDLLLQPHKFIVTNYIVNDF